MLGLLCVSGLVLSACDELLTEIPKDILVADNLYTNLAGFEAGLNALYANVRNERVGQFNGANALRIMPAMVGTDNAFVNWEYSGNRLFNEWGSFNNPEYSGFRDLWYWLYQAINGANTIINRSETPDINWTEAEKNEVLAQARLFRAWAYWHLTYLFGDVPLNLQESTGANIRTDWERTPRKEVREQMVKDLLFAEQYLPGVAEFPGGLSKAVARHYLADVYLALDEPAKAEAKAELVTESGDYQLITERYGVRADEPGVPFMDQFYDGNVFRSQGNTEALWVLPNEMNIAGGGRNIMRRVWINRYYNFKGVQVSEEYGGRGIGRLAPTSWSINLYAPEGVEKLEPDIDMLTGDVDDRGSIYAIRYFYQYNDTPLPQGKELGDTLWLAWERERKTSTWPSPRKWEWADPQDVTGPWAYDDQPYLRLAHTLLLQAEAEFQQGKPGEAAETLNRLRRRAGATEITAADVTLDFILDEASRELLAEGHRRYRLLRTNTWLERTQKYNPVAGPNITARDTVFPIPQSVIDANLDGGMEQSPGY